MQGLGASLGSTHIATASMFEQPRHSFAEPGRHAADMRASYRMSTSRRQSSVHGTERSAATAVTQRLAACQSAHPHAWQSTFDMHNEVLMMMLS